MPWDAHALPCHAMQQDPTLTDTLQQRSMAGQPTSQDDLGLGAGGQDAAMLSLRHAHSLAASFPSGECSGEEQVHAMQCKQRRDSCQHLLLPKPPGSHQVEGHVWVAACQQAAQDLAAPLRGFATPQHCTRVRRAGGPQSKRRKGRGILLFSLCRLPDEAVILT